MLTTLTPAQMKALEADFMAQTGVPGSMLMEMAAHAVVEAVTRHAPSGSRVLFLCGPGNNGGDGYAAARLWRMAGGDAVVWELGEPATPDARMNRTLLTLQGVTPMPAQERLPEGCACIVDALFGTGLTRPLDSACARLAELCNASGASLVATDIPSHENRPSAGAGPRLYGENHRGKYRYPADVGKRVGTAYSDCGGCGASMRAPTQAKP